MKTNGTSQKILELAAGFLTGWEKENLSLDNCLDDLRKNGSPIEKSAVSSLLFEYFRHKGFIDGLISKHAKKDHIRQDMRLLLCCAATQIFFQTGIASQSAVNVAVDYAKTLRGPAGGGFINAMLRAMIRDTSFDHHAIPKSFPDSLKKRWEASFGKEETSRLTDLFASNPPLSFRARRNFTEQELHELDASVITDLDFVGNFQFYEARNPHVLFEKNYLEKAEIYIQDPATSLPFSLLDKPVSGRILDACAAPGGKTILLNDLFNGSSLLKITAADRSALRLQQLNVNLRRAGIRARSVQADARQMPFSQETFDWILADVPCSNTGVIRRRPDAPWRFSEKRLREIVQLQAQILDSLSLLLRKDGTLVYSTCSIEKEEDSCQVQDFLKRHPDFVLIQERLLLPHPQFDGAYGAILRKTGQ